MWKWVKNAISLNRWKLTCRLALMLKLRRLNVTQFWTKCFVLKLTFVLHFAPNNRFYTGTGTNVNYLLGRIKRPLNLRYMNNLSQVWDLVHKASMQIFIEINWCPSVPPSLWSKVFDTNLHFARGSNNEKWLPKGSNSRINIWFYFIFHLFELATLDNYALLISLIRIADEFFELLILLQHISMSLIVFMIVIFHVREHNF